MQKLRVFQRLMVATSLVVLSVPVLPTPSAIAEVTEIDGVPVVAISTGRSHTCAVTSAGDAYCWGANTRGQLGNGTDIPSTVPVRVKQGQGLAAGSVAAISAGGSHTCAVTTVGDAYCWGHNFYGQLGDGTLADRSTPAKVQSGAGLAAGSVAFISAGSVNTCAVTSGGDAYCWGFNGSGQLGDGTTTTRSTPVLVQPGAGLSAGSVATISTGDSHTCAVTTAGDAYCWGYNDSGQLGDGTTTSRSTPVLVQPGEGLALGSVGFIYAGSGHVCAVTTGGNAYCWGRNNHGQLGDGTTTSRSTPVLVQPGEGLAAGSVGFVSAGRGSFSGHTCAITTGGDAYCWGHNHPGQLGDGTTIDRSTPVLVHPGAGLSAGSVTAISTGARHTCAVTTAGDPYCWGDNDSGQLGDGTRLDRNQPSRVTWLGQPALLDPVFVSPSDPVLVSPVEGFVFAPGEAQVFTINAQHPDGLSYVGRVEVYNALTDALVRRFDTALAASGMDSSGSPLSALPAGTYRWVVVAEDTAGGRSGVVSGTFGVASAEAFVSASCDPGDALVDGFFGDSYVRARSHSPSPDVAWVCVRVDDGGAAGGQLGGRLEVVSADSTVPVAVDLSAVACQAPDDGALPRPLYDPTIGDPSDPMGYLEALFDLRRADNTVTVCASVAHGGGTTVAGSFSVTGLALGEGSELRLIPDLPGSHQGTRAPMDTLLASSACQQATEGVSRLVDAEVAGSDLWLYTQHAGSVSRACIRAESGTQGGGGVLKLTQGESTPPTFEPALNAPDPGETGHACALNVYSQVTPVRLDVRRTTTGEFPAGVCLTVDTQTIHVLATPGAADPPEATWTADA